MITLVSLFLAIGSFALGAWVGWYLRSRPESAPSQDPEMELRELKDAHAGCATRIRNLHLELAQLESQLAMAGIDAPPRLEAPDEPVSEPPPPGTGAARLASLIDALGAERAPDSDAPESEHEPAAFMSILPANLVEDGVKEVDLDGASTAASLDERPAEEVVISLSAAEDPDIEIEVGEADDLKRIKGIGPKIESILNDEGITTFRQVAELDDETIDRLGETLGAFRGRIERDDWVGSARRLLGERTLSY